MILISDSMMATGMPDGEYALGGQPVQVKGNRALLADGTIASRKADILADKEFILREVIKSGMTVTKQS